jgi:hypothetical protein
MLSAQELLESISAELQACDGAHPPDVERQFRRILERYALKRHQEWLRESMDDQNVLRQIADSLEKNLVEVRQLGSKIYCTD